MNWNNAKEKSPSMAGVYWVQSRSDFGYLEVRYHSAYWSGRQWSAEPGSAVFYWDFIETAPEPDGAYYYDELGRMKVVAAQERGVDLQTYVGRNLEDETNAI